MCRELPYAPISRVPTDGESRRTETNSVNANQGERRVRLGSRTSEALTKDPRESTTERGSAIWKGTSSRRERTARDCSLSTQTGSFATPCLSRYIPYRYGLSKTPFRE